MVNLMEMSRAVDNCVNFDGYSVIFVSDSFEDIANAVCDNLGENEQFFRLYVSLKKGCEYADISLRNGSFIHFEKPHESKKRRYCEVVIDEDLKNEKYVPLIYLPLKTTTRRCADIWMITVD